MDQENLFQSQTLDGVFEQRFYCLNAHSEYGDKNNYQCCENKVIQLTCMR
jgi:hypothetical protein